MRRLPSALSVVLSLILALSSIGMAAMGHGLLPGAAGSVVVMLCGSDTPVLVDLPGAEPEEAGHDHPECPGCLLHGALALVPQIGDMARVRGPDRAHHATWSAAPTLPDAPIQSMARGPPDLI